MTCRELHIGVEQGLQQVAANTTRKFLDDEIDWILNKIQNRFIQSKLKPSVDIKGNPTGGFEVSQLDADAIRTVIVTSYSMVPYVDDGRRYKCFLPPDYSYLLSDWSYTKLLCGTDAPVEKASRLYITGLRQEHSIASAAPFYATVKVELGSTTQDLPTDLPYGQTYVGYKDKNDISFLIPYIARIGNYYWERFNTLNYPGYYINVSDRDNGTSPNVTPKITVDTNVTQATKLSTLDLVQHTNPGDYYDNRLSATSKISGMNSTEFIKTSYYSPISELSNGILYIYKDKNFTVSEVGISYIRKPLPISLPLNLSSELPEEFHQALIDLCVEHIKGVLENKEGYAITKDENASRVVL